MTGCVCLIQLSVSSIMDKVRNNVMWINTLVNICSLITQTQSLLSRSVMISSTSRVNRLVTVEQQTESFSDALLSKLACMLLLYTHCTCLHSYRHTVAHIHVHVHVYLP